MTSPRVNALSPNAELFYRRLMSVVDDYGRYFGNATLLRAACYPFQVDRVNEASISKHFAECVGARLIVPYIISGTAYLQMLNTRQQTRSKSKFPEPPSGLISKCEADAKLMESGCESNAPVVEVGVVDESVVENSAERVALAAPASPPNGFCYIPLADKTEFAVPHTLISELETAYPAVDVPATLKEIRLWCLTNPAKCKTLRGAPAFINRWFSKEQNRG